MSENLTANETQKIVEIANILAYFEKASIKKNMNQYCLPIVQKIGRPLQDLIPLSLFKLIP